MYKRSIENSLILTTNCSFEEKKLKKKNMTVKKVLLNFCCFTNLHIFIILHIFIDNALLCVKI